MPTIPDKIIDKKIATKFHYVKVDKDEYELTDEMLLLLDDKTLNKFIPLRRLAPYREKKELPLWEKKQLYKELQKELERKKRELNAMSQRDDQTAQANTKILSKKKKTDEPMLSKEDYKKKKRLETYGL